MLTERNNRALAHEARTTTDILRQAELVSHPSDLVLHALAANPNLDERVAENVKNRLSLLRESFSEAAKEAVKTEK